MLKNRCIIVTGASRGIGRSIAFESAKNGAHVGINYLESEKEARDLKDEIQKAGFHEPILLEFDAITISEIEHGLESFLSVKGRIDGFVNNAAKNLPGLLPVLEEEEIRGQIDSALLGPIFCCKAVIPLMLPNRTGSIVNIGSIVTEKSFRGQSVYAAAKGGLLALTRALAREYGKKGIRVNCVQPGAVETDMFESAKRLAGDEILKQIPLGRYCPSKDVASLVVYLLSHMSDSITGVGINIDGGYSL